MNFFTRDSVETAILNSIKYQKEHPSVSSVKASVDSVANALEAYGFLNVAMDTVIKSDSLYKISIQLRDRIDRVRIHFSNTNIHARDLFRISNKISDDTFEVSIEALPAALTDISRIYESRGRVFTKVRLKNIAVRQDIIEADLEVRQTGERYLDKIIVKGYPEFPRKFLSNYLDLKTTTIFNEQVLKKISDGIDQLIFVEEVSPSEVLFTNDSTIVYLNLTRKQASSFDGLIGFQSKETGKGLSFNGHLDVSLNNLFNSGESLKVFWKNNGNERQLFKLAVDLPYFLDTKFSPEFELSIQKQDSSFVNMSGKYLVDYSLSPLSSIGVFMQNEKSTTLGDNLSAINVFQSLFLGLRYNLVKNKSGLLFPTVFGFQTELSSGKRKIQSAKTNQYRIFLNLEYLLPLNKRNYFYFRNETNSLISRDSILVNELYRIGGATSIRGFNEDSILASSLNITNFEYRYSTNNSSYFYTITDLGFVKNEVDGLTETIFSLGLGYAFKTNFSKIDLSYALGKYTDSPFDIQNSRFHIKIVSSF